MIYVPKICSTCKKEKPYSEFQKSSCKKDGYSIYCKECTHIRDKQKYIKHGEKHKQRSKLYYFKNREKILQRQSIYGKTKRGKLANLKAVRKYEASERGKAVKTVYRQSEQGKLVSLECIRRYNASAHGKAVKTAYNQSERGKFTRKLNNFRKNLLQTAHKLLADMSLEANSGNEKIFLAYNTLKETIISLTEMGKRV